MVEQIIMSSEAGAANGLAVESIEPRSGSSFRDQLESCLRQLSDFGEAGSDPGRHIAQQSFFIATTSRKEYEEKSALIMDGLGRIQHACMPATAIVAQPPEAGRELVLELICTSTGKGKEVNYKEYHGIPYTVVDYGTFKVVHANGLKGCAGDGIREAAEKAFDSLKGILDSEGLAVQDIVRQWNYVEDIAHLKNPENSTQNYQVFNDVRARYYELGDFRQGYPAATGIGMSTAGIIVGFIAVTPHQNIAVRPIRNPRQVDAHRYSEDMLLGRETGIMNCKCTPKFERAKMLKLGTRTYIYVSGTASIVGEKSLHPGDVEAQTHTTIDNINELFTRENQRGIGLDFDPLKVQFSHLRVYVKKQEDIPAVKAICAERLHCESALYLQADICREELLVEIEGMFSPQ